MSQVRPGGQGSGQRPGGSSARRPATRTGAAQQSAARAGGAKAGAGRGPAGKGPAGKGPGGKGSGRASTTISAPPPRRFSPATMGIAAIGVVIVIILVFVIVKVTGSSTTTPPSGQLVTTPFPAPASLVAQVTGVPSSVVNTVGTGQGVTAPVVLNGQPALTSGGKPEVLYIGAEFCPYCAAERWAMLNAFSRFGTWTGVKETTSSPWDQPPAIATFSFRDAKLSSPYFSFVPVEHQTNDTNGLGTRKTLQRLTKQQSNLWTNYESHFGLQTGYPFIDFGNKVFVLGPSYDPATVLQGLSQSDIASHLSNAKSTITQSIIGAANYLTASVCALTHDQPAEACSATGVRAAATAMKLG